LPDIEGIDGAGNFKEYIRWWFNLSYINGGGSNAFFELSRLVIANNLAVAF